MKAGNPAKYRSFTKWNYRHNLQVYTQKLGKGYDAHHIYPKAGRFRKHWKCAGINNFHPSNMAWWKSGSHQNAAKDYNRAWANFFNQYKSSGDQPTRQEIIDAQKSSKKTITTPSALTSPV